MFDANLFIFYAYSIIKCLIFLISIIDIISDKIYGTGKDQGAAYLIVWKKSDCQRN